MASALNTKINSYALERGIEFDESYRQNITRTGSNSLGSYSLANSPEPVYESTVGPVGGSGSWKFVSSSTNSPRFSTTSASELVGINDRDYTQGFWFKISALPELTTPGLGIAGISLFVMPPATTIGWAATVAPSNSTSTQDGTSLASRLIVNCVAGTYMVGPIVVPDKWYYLAVRRIGNAFEMYVDGSLVSTATNTAASGLEQRIAFGALGNEQNVANCNFWISNFHQSTSSVINATAISEIWAVGSPTVTNINYSSEPMTASATKVDSSLKIDDIFSTTPATASVLMTEPTIIVTSGDSTYVTTSFIASTLFPSNYAVYVERNINITITETLNASTELINNVNVSTGTDESFSATEFTASAEMVEPVLARQPMTASALMGNHSAIVAASYYNLVKGLDPYLYIYDGSATPFNAGYQSGTFTVSSGLQKLQTPPQPLNLVGEAKAWRSTNDNGVDASIRFNAPSNETSFDAILATQEWSFEQWISMPAFNTDFRIINDPSLSLTFEESAAGNVTRGIFLSLKTGISNSSYFQPISTGPTSQNNVYHVVVTSTKISSTQQLIRVWLNTQIVFSETYTFTPWTPNKNTFFVINSDGGELYHDEIALYDFPLNSSQIIQHYNFVSTLSPNFTYYEQPLEASAESGDHQFVVTSNVDAIATPITASADFVMPSVLAQKVINYSTPALTASALNTDVTVFYGWTIYADPAIAAAEAKEGFALNTTYSDYIQANIAPYRYVTFDTATPYADFGTDNDYSVAATVVGGTIVNPDLGINGKSAKTAGTSYITDGVILKESEHDDNWGTGNNSYHSSFWMERAIDDASTTGLRVLWNLNGHNDNQNLILYHYQNKLHLQINNQVGAPITITSANNVNVFDYTRHNIVINSHHNNNKNHLYVYVDAVLVLDQDINTYAVTTINNPIHVGANDEANNFPRLGIGCLITPFADTALPVVPTNTKLILDEIYWDKNQILQTEVTNIFNVMPDKVNANTVAEALTASAQMVMPTIITTVNFVAAPATASTEFVNPSLYIERFIVTSADIMDASALMGNAIGFVQIDIAADVMAASAIFNAAGVIITIPGSTMHASAITKYETLLVGGRLTYDYISPWVKYLRATDAISILPTREVV
jgi:hypothetical protein